MSEETLQNGRRWTSAAARARHRRGTATQPSLRVAVLAVTSLSVGTARACPDCTLGQVARAQFWSDNFAGNLLIAVLPFMVMATAAILAERLLGRTDGKEGQRHD